MGDIDIPFSAMPDITTCGFSDEDVVLERTGKVQSRDFCYEGEMHIGAAFDPDLRNRLFLDNRLQGKSTF